MAQALKHFAPPTPDEKTLSADLHSKLGMVEDPSREYVHIEYLRIQYVDYKNCIRLIDNDNQVIHLSPQALQDIERFAESIGWRCD